jgi:hypothetical protein
MQVTQDFCLQNKAPFSGDVFPFDISGGKIARSFFAQILLTQSDATLDEPVWARH